MCVVVLLLLLVIVQRPSHTAVQVHSQPARHHCPCDCACHTVAPSRGARWAPPRVTDDAAAAAPSRLPHTTCPGNAIVIGTQPVSPHLHRCSWPHTASADEHSASFNFDAFSENDAAARVTCDARSLAEIRVSVDRKNSSSSLALCITSRDRHQLLLPTFWGENELRRIPMRLHVHMRLHMRLACAHVPDPILSRLFSCAGAPTIPPMARWGQGLLQRSMMLMTDDNDNDGV